MAKKKIIIYHPNRFPSEVWLPMLWSQAKTYYERNGTKVDDWEWVPSYIDIYADNYEKIQNFLIANPPSVFGISLYLWNYQIAHRVAKWVKHRWPNCLVVSGGPHQFFQHDDRWFLNHPYIDASLPGDCYGEIFFQQILDQLSPDGKIDFDQIIDVCYPKGKNKFPTYSKQRSTPAWKKAFDYNWPSWAQQSQHIEKYAKQAFNETYNIKLLAGLETTRGCPYGCTYCDWGGGINTAVIKKDLSVVSEDITFLSSLDLKMIFIMDANFGIFGHRDIAITECLAENHKKSNSRFVVGYGGFAKTANKLRYIKEIIKIGISNDLMWMQEFKASMQSLDPDVLNNIDRKNVSLDLQVSMFQDLARSNKKLPIVVEMMLGLPGMTLEKFYYELDELCKHRLSVLFYEWFLLPEAPAYSHQYRSRHGLQTLVKESGWYTKQVDGSLMEIVIESATYSNIDYCKMIISVGLYHVFVRGGLLNYTLSWISKTHNIGLGNIIKSIVDDLAYFDQVKPLWMEILQNQKRPCTFIIDDTEHVSLEYWFAWQCCCNHEFYTNLISYLNNKYRVPAIQSKLDQLCQRREKNFKTILFEFQSFQNSGNIMKKNFRRWFQNIWHNLIDQCIIRHETCSERPNGN